ncbi:MAG: signal peptide peptidase SppA [Gammaproteobacteria bacterium]|nr:signal peptide peptidase SppA [Gammaproteobacteria bacterium]
MSEPSVFSRVNQSLLTARTVAGNLVFILVLVFLAGALIGSCQSIDVEGNPALLIRPQGSLVEQHSIGNPVEEILSGTGQRQEVLLGDLTEAIRRATHDERIKVMVLDLTELEGLASVHAEVLERSLQTFREAGKEVIGWGTWISQANYRLLSGADALYMHPMGGLLFEGFAAHSLYFKDLLDKLKVQIHVFRVGEFKSAVEPYTSTGMSDEARAADRDMVLSMWAGYASAIGRNRKLNDGDFNAFVEEIPDRIEAAGGDTARAVLEAKLVDELLSFDEFNARVVDKVGEDSSGEFNAITVDDYLAATGGRELPSPDANIALIRLTGPILDAPDGQRTITPDAANQQIRNAREDDQIKALVVRIDSPGGSAFASELIRRELELVQVAKKPVVISMGEVAASGGYWIASTADTIFAHDQTITGSIGVFSLLPTVDAALTEIGVQSDGVGTGPLSPTLNPFGALPESYARIAQASVQKTYTDFLNLVARGRSLDPAEVSRVAEGRVWMGAKARELGLVSEIGDLDAAIAHAAELADVAEPLVREFEPAVDFRDALIHELLAAMPSLRIPTGPAILDDEVQELMAQMAPIVRQPGIAWVLCSVCQAVR